MGLSLVAFDTDHIKEFVFGTDRLKEIRGASSILDRLNRREMEAAARKLDIQEFKNIYTNGGAGLFVVDSEKAEAFKLRVQQVYRERSKGRASVTAVVQELPPGAPDKIELLMKHPLKRELDFMRYLLRLEKDSPPTTIALPSHPLMRPCSSCGIEYAEQYNPEQYTPAEEDEEDITEEEAFCCASCREKQKEDRWIKTHISGIVSRIMKGEQVQEKDMWGRILRYLKDAGYSFGDDPGNLYRPNDFNEFRQFARSKDYLGLIYADANNMGVKTEQQKTLQELQDFANKVDNAVFRAMSQAIAHHLPIASIKRDGEDIRVFPFDILLVGGDDIVMVTDAAKAMDVALSIAQQFRLLTNNEHSLSVAVVLAPIKYPFGMMLNMAESTLKFAKKAGHTKQSISDSGDDTRINFLTVTGGSEPDFKETYDDLYHKIDDANMADKREFYATLRPYTPEDLERLLNLLRAGRESHLGRTKLHQLREAILRKNLTTSVRDALALLLNWSDQQRSYVVNHVYEFGRHYALPRSNPADPLGGFPRVTFPWFADGKSDESRDIYRTPLLDFIEIYDFVAREGEENNAEG